MCMRQLVVLDLGSMGKARGDIFLEIYVMSLPFEILKPRIFMT